MNLPRSAVTQTIERLEKNWGVTLFDRSSRPMHLPPQGQTAVVIARRYLAEAKVFRLLRRKKSGLCTCHLRNDPRRCRSRNRSHINPASYNLYGRNRSDSCSSKTLCRRKSRPCRGSWFAGKRTPLSAILPNLTLLFVSYQRDSLDRQESQC